MARTLRLTADKKGITLDELDDFVKDARAAGIRGDEFIFSEEREVRELEIELS